MASTRDRQRKLARLKHERQMARRAAAAHRRRRVQAGVVAGAVVLALVMGGLWIFGVFDSEPTTTASPQCQWNGQDATANADLKDVGLPPENGNLSSGHRTLSVSLNGQTVTADLDLSASPCGGASLKYLADQGFFNGTTCHEITDGAALRCGDPSGTGNGGAAYTFFGENVPDAPQPSESPSADPSASASPDATPSASPPADAAPVYRRGTVALIGNPPGSFGSQFLIFFKDFTPAESPAYSIIGDVTGGQDVVDAIGKAGAVDNGSGEQTKPKDTITIDSLTVTDPGEPTASPTAGADATLDGSATPNSQ
ncbi:peptidylprolyl isomerase [Rhizomonospora bruguierae]|uniref:peptidylprolyl isomerase n=1 Tax=Rhizomonospora bruguierae TaxID=1581705 RepID=UPI001BCCC892|nr:peptidylprolyl isomerase [Micromonospora sp. NBRC 107566]